MSLAPDLPPENDDEAFRTYLRRLDPKTKAELAKRVDRLMNHVAPVWFCGNRQCDGKPHGQWNYKHARGQQYPPPGQSWIVWLLRGGRGSGKTRTGAEYTRYISKKIPWISLIGPTAEAVRNVMIEGESGLIAVCEAAGEYVEGMYEPSKKRFTFASGARAQLFTAEKPKGIRGSQCGFFWADEAAHWENAQAVWDMAMYSLRLGARPHCVVTTTPLPTEFVKDLIDHPDTVAVPASTYDNIDNLADAVVRKILADHEGTFLGRQEIYGEVIEDRVGALWSSEQFGEKDFYYDLAKVEFDRVLVGIDPAGSQGKRSDLTGIIVGAKRGDVLHAIDDVSGKFSPAGWARAAINAYEKYSADAIVVERNYGGDMCRATLKAEKFEGRIIEARATDGKRLRAEPISAKYEQHLARHRRGGALTKLETEMVSWVPGEGKSPNRVDAWVWVATALTKGGGKGQIAGGGSTPIAPRGPRNGPLWGRR